jgi:hypothetical protein
MDEAIGNLGVGLNMDISLGISGARPRRIIARFMYCSTMRWTVRTAACPQDAIHGPRARGEKNNAFRYSGLIDFEMHVYYDVTLNKNPTRGF